MGIIQGFLYPGQFKGVSMYILPLFVLEIAASTDCDYEASDRSSLAMPTK